MFRNDLYLACRQFKQRPAFGLTVITILALTLSAATIIFSLLDAALLRPFPYPEPDRLLRIKTHEPGIPGSEKDAAWEDTQDWRRLKSFDGIASYLVFEDSLTANGVTRPVRTAFTTPELFKVLKVQPILGATFTSNDDQLNGDVHKVLLSYTLWREMFAGDTQIVNRTIRLRGETFIVLGIMPAGFRYPEKSDVWAPLMARYAGGPNTYWRRRDSRFYMTLTRLKDGVSPQQAQSELESAMERIRRNYPDQSRNVHTRLITLREAEAGNLRPYVLSVAAGVLLLLAIGCANVAGLFVARSAVRSREIAIRIATGAGPGHLFRQLLVESLLYGVCGGTLGCLLAWFGIGSFVRFIPVELPFWFVLKFDLRAFGFVALVVIGTSTLFGLIPLLQHSKPDLNELLRQGAKGSSGVVLGRLRRGLVVAEIALTSVLLVSAGLMLHSLARLMAIDPGVNKDRVLVVAGGKYVPHVAKHSAVAAYTDDYLRIVHQVAALPGVRQVSAGSNVPLRSQSEQRPNFAVFTRDHATPATAFHLSARGADVMPGYFSTLGVRILAGRDFRESDTIDTLPVIVISQRLAALLFPGRSALGEQLRWGSNTELDPWMTVIGVVGNTRWHLAERAPGYEVYWSFRQYPGPNAAIVIRTSLNPLQMAGPIRKAVRLASPDFAISEMKSMRSIADDAAWQRRLWGWVLGIFAAIAVLLSAVGVYGVVSHLVAQRTKEIGIRMAIGATSSSILSLVLRYGMVLVLAGSAFGLGASLVASRVLRGLLWGISAADPSTFVAVPILLVAVTLLACSIPALRAARIDPMKSLRED